MVQPTPGLLAGRRALAVGILKANWVRRQTVVFADGRVRMRNVQCLGEKNGARVGEAWIGDRMALVTEVEFGAWREERAEGVSGAENPGKGAFARWEGKTKKERK